MRNTEVSIRSSTVKRAKNKLDKGKWAKWVRWDVQIWQFKFVGFWPTGGTVEPKESSWAWRDGINIFLCYIQHKHRPFYNCISTTFGNWKSWWCRLRLVKCFNLSPILVINPIMSPVTTATVGIATPMITFKATYTEVVTIFYSNFHIKFSIKVP